MEAVEKFKEFYIKQLLRNHNIGAGENQRNLVTSLDYENILNGAVNVIKSYPDSSPSELREILYNASGIENQIYHFINERKIAPSLSITYGTPLYQESISIGSSYGSDTIYDLASITKLFTSLSIMKLVSMNILDLNAKIKDILPEYTNIDDTTIYDLLTFRIPLLTSGRIESAGSPDEARKRLQSAAVKYSFNGTSAYMDIGAMILKYVIEKVTNMDFFQFVKENFLAKANMASTFVKVPNKDLKRLAHTDGSISFIDNNNIVINGGYEFGMPHDPKARTMQSNGPDLCGHAGLFSTTKDVGNLCTSLIQGTLLDPQMVLSLSKNVTGGKHVLNSSSIMQQYFGKLVYSKNPIQTNSEIKHYLSGSAFASAGFTGNKLTCDPLNEIYAVLCCNRTNDRVVQIPNYITRKQHYIDDAHYIELPDETLKLCGTDFVYNASDVKAPAEVLALQYKFIEDFFNLCEFESKEHSL